MLHIDRHDRQATEVVKKMFSGQCTAGVSSADLAVVLSVFL
jgi:hypothetical protein